MEGEHRCSSCSRIAREPSHLSIFCSVLVFVTCDFAGQNILCVGLRFLPRCLKKTLLTVGKCVGFEGKMKKGIDLVIDTSLAAGDVWKVEGARELRSSSEQL